MIEGEKSLRAVVSEKIHKAVEVYRRWSGSAVMPTRERLEPLDIPDLLPNIILIEVMPDARLSVRLAGEAVQVHFGDNYTGKYLDEIEFGEARSKIMNDYTTAHRERRAVFSDHKFRSVNGVHYDIERALFPFGTQERVTHLLAVLIFSELPDDLSSC